MASKKISKKKIITKIFEYCKKNKKFEFNNDLVREILKEEGSKTNPYDMTKLDNKKSFPEVLLEEDYFIVHLGDGKHKFLKGIDKVFHKFEKITEDEKISWP